MKLKSLILYSFVFLMSHFSMAFAQKAVLTISEIKVPKGEDVVQWVKPNDKKWHSDKPLYTVKDSTSELAAKVWMAMSPDALLMHVEVTDDVNMSTQTRSDIWQEDGVQIAIDAQGQGAGTMPKETRGMVGNDDCGFAVTLGSEGAYGFAWFWADEKFAGVMPNEMFTASRNEKTKLTSYTISIPWTKLHTIPGAYPVLGVAIQINDSDPEKKEQTRLYIGRGADGVLRPGLFKKLSIASTAGNFSSVLAFNDLIRNNGDVANLFYSVSSTTETYLLKAGFDGNEKIVEILPTSNPEIRQFEVSLKCLDNNVSGKISSSLINKKSAALVQKLDLDVISMEATVNRFFQRMDSLIARPQQHPLFMWHLKSVKALALNEWNKTSLLWASNPSFCDETFRFIKRIDEGFEGDAADWNSYLDNKRTLFISFISKTDGTLQYYGLDLPKNWDPNKTYPLLVELHGAGNPHPLNGLASSLGASNAVVDLLGYTSAISFSQTYGIGYHITPFGRGNLGYQGIAETDVWEAFKDISERFKIDENRRYLYGFSMGGGGTWSLGLRTPDLWAGIGIFAGAIHRDMQFPETFTKNVKHLPVFIEIGEHDFLFEYYTRMLSELKKNVPKIYTKIIPGMDHKYPNSLQKIGVEWMTQFERKRPDTIYFIADRKEHTGVWGIQMERDERISAAPWFQCVIDGQNLKIKSEGTNKITIQAGERGLNLTGNINVEWNGKKVYSGIISEEIELIDRN